MIFLDLSNTDIISIWGIGVTLLLSIIGSIIYSAFKFGSILNDIGTLKQSSSEITTDLRQVIYSHGQIKVKVDELWRQKTTKSGSPMILNDIGKKIIVDSKISDLTNKFYSEILNSVKSLNPPNPFQAQELLISVVNKFKEKEECKSELETAAFNSGNNVDTVLFVAAIDIRDRIIQDLGFNLDDIDKHDPKNSSPATAK